MVLILWGNKEYALCSCCNFYSFLLLLRIASAIPLWCRSCTCEFFPMGVEQTSLQKDNGIVCMMGENTWVGYGVVFYLLALETYIWNWEQWFVWIQLREMMTFCYVHTSQKISWQGNLWNNVYCFEALLLLSIFQLRTDFPNNRCLFSFFICAKSSLSWVARGGHKCQNHRWSSVGHCP